MEPALDRFGELVQAIQNRKQQDPTIFREKILMAYGVEDESKSGKFGNTNELAELEKEFAERCLKGEGPDENEAAFSQGNLCTVLTKEIGTQTEEHPMVPWFGGDWISMARLIIHNADWAMAVDNVDEVPARVEDAYSLIRVWPVRDIIGEAQRNKKEGNMTITVEIGNSQNKMEIRLQTTTTKYEEYEWIILGEAPGQLGKVSNQRLGLSENLWIGMETDPGEAVKGGQ